MDIDALKAQRLFQAVVTQSLVDATAPDKAASAKPLKRRQNESAGAYRKRMADAMIRRAKAANRDRDEAREWLLRDMTSFPEIVSLAGFNPTDVRERARKLANSGWPQRVRPDRLAA